MNELQTDNTDMGVHFRRGTYVDQVKYQGKWMCVEECIAKLLAENEQLTIDLNHLLE